MSISRPASRSFPWAPPSLPGVVCGFKFGASRAQGLPQSRSCLPPSSAKHPRVGCTMDCTLVVKNRAAIHVSLVGSFHLLLPQRAVSPRRHLPQQWAPTSACPPTPPAPARLCHRVPSVCPHHHQRPPPGPPQPRRVSTTVARKPAKGPPGWTTNRAPAAACNGTTFKIPQRLTELQTGTQRDSICLWPQTLLASTPDTPQTLGMLAQILSAHTPGPQRSSIQHHPPRLFIAFARPPRAQPYPPVDYSLSGRSRTKQP